MADAHRYHFPVMNLRDVARSFTIGQATFRPRGWLASTIEAHSDDDQTLAQLRTMFVDTARELDCATADALAQSRDEAKLLVADAVAALRFCQRRSHRFLSLDRQTFGLAGEVGSTVERHWRTTAEGEFAAGGYKVSGVIGDWEFTSDQLDSLVADPVVSYLDRCLRQPESSLEQIEARILTALRLINGATVMAAPGVRIVLLASALEALLGDKPMQDRTHRISLRAALLTCDGPGGAYHSPERPCPYFAQKTYRDLRQFMERERAHDRHGICSAYWWHHEMFDARNEVLHEAKLDFDHRLAEKFEGRIDALVARVLLWRSQTGGGLPDLDTAMREAAVSGEG